MGQHSKREIKLIYQMYLLEEILWFFLHDHVVVLCVSMFVVVETAMHNCGNKSHLIFEKGNYRKNQGWQFLSCSLKF